MKWLFSVFFLSILIQANGQEKTVKKPKYPTYFGLQIRPVIPTNIIGSTKTEVANSKFTTTLSQKLGYSFGATVRLGFTKLLAFETGINFTQRNYDISMAVPDSNQYATNDLSFVMYDIPLNLLVYVPFNKTFYMNASMGIALTAKPTDVSVTTHLNNITSFLHYGDASPKFGFDLNANFGFEYRTDKKGFFYLGISGRVPFQPVFNLITEYNYSATTYADISKVDGTFFAIDFKYFFPNIAKKGVQFTKGPIE